MPLDFPAGTVTGQTYDRYVWNDTDQVWNLNLPETQFQGLTLSGGTETTVTIAGVDYKVNSFTTTGTLTVTGNGLIEYLVVAGGGGGGNQSSSNNRWGGGGGAGGVLQGFLELSAGSYTVTIGAGGAGGPAFENPGSQGGDSSIGSLVIAKGGGYGGSSGTPPAIGGSGGGGGWTGGSTPFPGQGGTGGAGGGGTASRTGGGGAGARGDGEGWKAVSTPALGGAGLVSTITGSSVTYARGGDSGPGTATVRGGGGFSCFGTTVTNGVAGIVIFRYRA